MFTFTENDLPPGPLAKRLLAAKVSVVLIHAPPDAPSPDHRQVHAVDWEGMRLRGGGERDTTASSSALALIGPAEHSVTPETDPEETSDESTYENAVANNHSKALVVSGGRGAYKSPARGAARISLGCEDDGRFYLSSDDDSASGTPARRNEGLRVTGGLDPVRVLSCSSPWNIQGTPGNLASGSGLTTPRSSTYPSPLRSCPRSAISSKRERLYEKTDMLHESTRQQATAIATAAPSGVPRWASSKTFGAPPARREDLPPKDTVDDWKNHQERRPRVAKPLVSLEGKSLALTAPQRADGVAGGHGAGDARGVRLSRKPWAAVVPGSTDANGPAVKLDKLALQEHARGSGSSSRGSTEEGQASKVIEINVPSKHSTTSSGFKRPSPAVKHLLDTAAARSFEDLQSSKHTSAFGSETDQSESESGGGLGIEMEPFSGFGGENASRAARALAVWADGGGGTRPASANPISPSSAPAGDTENRITVVATGMGASIAKLSQSEGLESIQPLKQRVWPPSRGVVAGVEEVQGALESPNGGDGQQPAVGRHMRRHGSTGMAWGEDAKLALARKRLQWEK